MTEKISIIIPTWNNYEFLEPCLTSILRCREYDDLFHIYVINNGHKDSCLWVENKDITVFNADKNLGWEGGLLKGLELAKAPIILFLNDDIHIPRSSKTWLSQMLKDFEDPRVGAVGPASNVVMGFQNIFADLPFSSYSAKFLIGFCLMVRKEALEKAGGVDDSLPGGDDLDLSIRLRQAGYILKADKEVFVYHHGFKTGTRVHGDHTKKGGWNAADSTERTNLALIKKHGFKTWWETLKGAYEMPVGL